jgi:uncharacterized membrane protein YhaH (DUF805 family)
MLRYFFSPMGRISRKAYLFFAIPVIVLGVAAGYADEYFFPEAMAVRDTGPITAILGLITLWPQIAITSKRFHDRNMSGWWQLAFYAGFLVGGFVLGWAIGMAGGSIEFVSGRELPTLFAGLAIILVTGGVEFAILSLLPGTRGRNEYGDDPLNPAKDVAEVFS